MKPKELRQSLSILVKRGRRHSVMIWGPPGIGKSSVVAQVARKFGLELIDLRLSQLTPTDLRGLPVAANGISSWYPPEFLPREGKKILFLDEFNMATPTLQGVFQQLILDRKVGRYIVPDGVFIWAAGNRKEDRGSTFEMPVPLANRFIHFHVEPDLDSFKEYAQRRGLEPRLLAFLSYRPELLHKIDPYSPAFPTPRSWELASQLHKDGLDISSAVGAGAAGEFYAFLEVYRLLPQWELILKGEGRAIHFPSPEDERYALINVLAHHSTPATVEAVLEWVMRTVPPEWTKLFCEELIGKMRKEKQIPELITVLQHNPKIGQLLKDFDALTRKS